MMKVLQREVDKARQGVKYDLPNGKEVLIQTTDKRIYCYQRWPDSPWESIDPEILRFTPVTGIAGKIYP